MVHIEKGPKGKLVVLSAVFDSLIQINILIFIFAKTTYIHNVIDIFETRANHEQTIQQRHNNSPALKFLMQCLLMPRLLQTGVSAG